MTTPKQEKLVAQSTHYMHIKTDRVPPFIVAGSYVFLEEIKTKDFNLVGSDIFVLAHENGAKQFLAGRRENHMLWFVDIRTGSAIKISGDGAMTLYKVKLVKSGDVEVPESLTLLHDQIVLNK
ncbi:hypothetical protein CLV59_105216 [Chitinophaga dinghuensis]|uniref:Uncharacterized protein n=1 Tax=Chitinophaga dinghuensis TaxID=1539050 RepID=A0A327VVZ6_9BACT|nr:hypothetical protein [Chitinophaga dinghuensis]RAJ80109.1 hypothetical protein CLV59_105216 [Chitinophaga dinghuensis]